MDEQKSLLHGLWRKAGSQAEPLQIPCGSESNATRLRFALYNSVRDVRKGKASADPSLKYATENCSVGFLPEDRAVLVIQQKVMTGLMQTIAGIVGEESGLKKSDEEVAAEASIASVMEKLGASAGMSEELPADMAAGLPRTTKYYTRD